MPATAKNTHHNPVGESKTPTGRNTPELCKYSLNVHFPVLRIGNTVIKSGVDQKEAWGISPLDACQWVMSHFRAAEWVEVVQ